MMSRPQISSAHLYYVATPFFHVATSLAATHVMTSKMMSQPQATPQSFQPYRNLKILGCNTLKTNPGRDLKSMSRPQTVHPKSQRGFSCHDQGLLTPNLIQVATPKRMSGHQPLYSRSRRQNNVATSPCLAQVGRAAQVVGERWRCRARCCTCGRPCHAHLLPPYHDLKTRSCSSAGNWQ